MNDFFVFLFSYLLWDSGVLGFLFSTILSKFLVLIEKYTMIFALGKGWDCTDKRMNVFFYIYLRLHVNE